MCEGNLGFAFSCLVWFIILFVGGNLANIMLPKIFPTWYEESDLENKRMAMALIGVVLMFIAWLTVGYLCYS